MPDRSSMAMSEAELLEGVSECLTLGGWRWTHILNSRYVTMGYEGLPDIIAVHPDVQHALLWELKSENGQPTPDQAAWLAASAGRRIDSRILRPSDYDHSIRAILGASAKGGIEW